MDKKVGWLAVVVLMGGCFSMGAQVDEQQLASFRKGQTTYAEVLSSIGSPTTQTVTSEGGRTAYWTYVEAKPRPETFIPIVGLLVGGSDTKSNIVMLQFDANGVLQEFSSTSSAIGAGTGLASGVNMSRVPDQPRQAPSD